MADVDEKTKKARAERREKLLAWYEEKDLPPVIGDYELRIIDEQHDRIYYAFGWFHKSNGWKIRVLYDEETADYALGITTEQHTMRSDTSHCATLIEVVNHVENKGIVGCLAWCQASCLAETIIVVELVGSTPFGRERRICYHSVKLCIAKSIRL